MPEQLKMTVDISNKLSFSQRKNVPLILQSEVAECGLASLAMISSYYGFKINLPPLRKKAGLSSQGMTLQDMIDSAGQLNLSSRAIKCDIDYLNNIRLPCILHWDLNHFVVLTGTKKNQFFYINDPSYGRKKLTYSEFSKSYTGIALELKPANTFKKKDERQTLKITGLWDKITGFKRTTSVLVLLTIVLQFASLLSPYYIQWVVDNVLLSNDQALLVVLAIGFMLIALFQTIVNAFRQWVILRFSSLLNLQIGSNLFFHLIRLPMDYFERRHVGDVVSKFSSINSIKSTLTTGLVEAFIDGVMAVTVLYMMFLYSTKLTSIVLLVVVCVLIVNTILFYPKRIATLESISANAKKDSIFLETLRAIQTIKLFGYEGNRQNSWLNKYADAINADISHDRVDIIDKSITNILSSIENILVIYFGAILVINGELTTGMLLAFMSYKVIFNSCAITFIDQILALKLLRVHLERVSDIALHPREPRVESFESINFNKVISVENLSFRYSESSDWVIENLSFKINPGERIAITGTSGCGKTTLAKILLGLLKPTSGSILIGGVNINEISSDVYRKEISAVMQNDMLLSGTVLENITLFDLDYNEEYVKSCCEKACILDDVNSLPMKLHTLVGDMGSSFSGGQLQRLFLARALYRDPKIIILDESTSHLDESNEIMVADNMSKLNITQILIAHRKETIDSADRIICLG